MTSKERLSAILRECDAHALRLTQARTRCVAIFPLSSDSYASLSDDQVRDIDQMVYRFTKLQDALGAKLFPAILSVLREDAASRTVYDMLSELEKAGAIHSAEDWIAMRETRNQLAHDYHDDPDEGSRYLTDLFNNVERLLATADSAARFAQDDVLPSMP
jgi:Fe2+ or Zn2+ uptake regulation protein